MASCTGSLTHFGTDPSSWTVEKLKEFLRQRNLPLTGRKNELVVRVLDFMETEELELEIDATSFKELNVESAISFMELPDSDWATTGLPEVDENIACTYLKRLGAYTKNYRTGIRLCSCGHVFDIEKACSNLVVYVKAKCRPTMRKNPVFYKCFVKVELIAGTSHVVGGNCDCPAGETQSCVHISALLLTLSEVTSKACTSMACIWSRPTSAGKAMLATNLDFGEATDEGYVVPDGPCLDPSKLLEECRKEGVQTGVGLYFIQEAERHKVVSQTVAYEVDSAPLIDPMEKLSKIERPITVNDLVESLQLTPVEVELIQTMTIGQRDNPLWMDARQWRITASNFGKVCNRRRKPGHYPSSLLKVVMGDYGHPVSPALEWGSTHEEIAIKLYEEKSGHTVNRCGFFVCDKYPFLGASPDGIILGEGDEFGIVEVKCPFVHRNTTISKACDDKTFHLMKTENDIKLCLDHDYYYQITGQLAITKAAYCDLVTWTCMDIHIQRIYFNADLWSNMLQTLASFYNSSVGPEIIRRLECM